MRSEGSIDVIDAVEQIRQIHELNALKPVSLLKAYVAGRGYSLWPEDLALVGDTQLIEESLAPPSNNTPDAPPVAFSITQLRTHRVVLAFKLSWPDKLPGPEPTQLHFWHAVLCSPPQSEVNLLALSDLGLSLLHYYETHYAEIGESLAAISRGEQPLVSPSWSERYFQLPKQLPSQLNAQTRGVLLDMRKLMPSTSKTASTSAAHSPKSPVTLWLAMSGWLVAILLVALLIWMFSN
jgi:hypothetical protein